MDVQRMLGLRWWDGATTNDLDETNRLLKIVAETYICGDAADSSQSSETLLVLIRNKATEYGVNIEGRLMWREAMETKPQAWNPVCGMKVNFICHISHVVGRGPNDGGLGLK